MILTLDQAVARRWRISGSSAFPFFLAAAMMVSSSRRKRRWPVVADEPRSKPRVVMATFQPLLTPPTTFSFGQRALVKKISLKSALPSTWAMGRTSMPGWSMGTSR